MDLNKNRLRDVAFDQIIRRGTAEILEEDEQGMLLRDKRHGLVFLVSDDFETGAEWLRKHEDIGYEILSIYSLPLAEYAMQRYGLTGQEICRQVVWTRPEAPGLSGIVRIRPAEDRDVPFISANYDDWEEWGHLVYEIGNIFVAELPDERGKTVGFVGHHMEDTMGLLFVDPEYRNMGIGLELEKFMIGEMLRMGLTPYGHVIVGNEKSMELQKSLGMEFWDGLMSWVYPGE